MFFKIYPPEKSLGGVLDEGQNFLSVGRAVVALRMQGIHGSLKEVFGMKRSDPAFLYPMTEEDEERLSQMLRKKLSRERVRDFSIWMVARHHSMQAQQIPPEARTRQRLAGFILT